MSSQTITLTIGARPTGDTVEAYWIRLVQPDREGDFATVADAAQVLDAVFDRKPCESSLTGGEDAVLNDDGTYAEAVAEEEYANVVNGVIDYDACLAMDKYDWTATLDIVRSHNSEPYKLVIEGATVEQTVLVRETVTQGLIFSGETSLDLEYPIISGLATGWSGSVVTKSGTAPTVTILGSTVNLNEATTGQLTLQYTTEYDRSTINVPGVSGEEKLQSAEALAFWHYLVEPLTLEPPDVDETSAGDNLLCRSGGNKIEIPQETVCWESIRQLTMCSCGGGEAHAEVVDVAVACPEGLNPGSYFQGTRTVLVGYSDCGEGSYDDDLADPKFYEERCCHPWPWPWAMPHCRVVSGVMGGGVGIAHGPDFYLGLYGNNTKIVGVSPRDGICGTITWKQQVNADTCCDFIDDIIPDQTNPTSISGGGRVRLCVGGGANVLTWKAGGGLFFDGGDNELTTVDRCVYVNAPSALCPNPVVNINDQCSHASIQLTNSSNPDPLSVTVTAAGSLMVGSVELLVDGGVPVYTLTSSGAETYFSNGLKQIELSTGGTVILYINPEQICLGDFDVTLSDACASTDSVTVNALTGTVCVKYQSYYSSLADWWYFQGTNGPTLAEEWRRTWITYTGFGSPVEIVTAPPGPPPGNYFLFFPYAVYYYECKGVYLTRYYVEGVQAISPACPGDDCELS